MITYDFACIKCIHYQEFPGCPAFEDGEIPEIILSGENDHSKPLPSQKNNIIFKSIEDETT